MTEQEMIDLALAENFAGAVVVDTKDIVFDPIFRPCCAENLCGQYGVNYTCPPDCGTTAEMENPRPQKGAGAADHLGDPRHHRQRRHQAREEGPQRGPAAADEEVP